MWAIANPNMVDDIRLLAREVSYADVVLDPGANNVRTEMISFSTGLFDWATDKNITGISTC